MFWWKYYIIKLSYYAAAQSGEEAVVGNTFLTTFFTFLLRV